MWYRWTRHSTLVAPGRCCEDHLSPTTCLACHLPTTCYQTIPALSLPPPRSPGSVSGRTRHQAHLDKVLIIWAPHRCMLLIPLLTYMVRCFALVTLVTLLFYFSNIFVRRSATHETNNFERWTCFFKLCPTCSLVVSLNCYSSSNEICVVWYMCSFMFNTSLESLLILWWGFSIFLPLHSHVVCFL